jgi:hypothetical protein
VYPDAKKQVHRRLEYFLLALIAAALAWQLFLPPVIGLADNGDFARIAQSFDLLHTSDTSDRFFRYFELKWRFDPSARWVSGFLSSESALVALSLPLNRLLAKDQFFDLRCLGFIHILILLFAAWLFIVYSRQLRPLARFVFLCLLFLIFTDAGYVVYFNSFYSEPSSFIFLFCTLALLLLTFQSPHIGTLLGCAFCCLFFVTAKPQNAALGVLLAVIFLRLRNLRSDRRWRLTNVALALGVVLVSAGYSVSNPTFSYKTTYYMAVFTELLKYSPTPSQDLNELGVSTNLAQYRGTTPFEPSVPRDSPEFRNFFDQMSFGKIGIFYLHHPGRLHESLNRTAELALLARPIMLGNFEKSAGLPPYERSRAFSDWSYWKRKYGPKTITSFEFLCGIETIGIVILYCRKRTLVERLLLELQALLMAMAVVQILTVSVTMGSIDAIKQMFLFNILFDISFAIALVWSVGRIESIAVPLTRRAWGSVNSLIVRKEPAQPDRNHPVQT